jgi:small subunit ribosomal protein S6
LATALTSEYELVLMLDPEVSDELRERIVSDAKGRIESGGTLKHDTAWGMRSLAYEIRRRNEADYRFFRFESGDSALLDSLDHELKIADGVLRFRLFKVDPRSPVVVPPAPTPGSGPPARPARRDDGDGAGEDAEAPAADAAPEAAPSAEAASEEAAPEEAAPEAPTEVAETPAEPEAPADAPAGTGDEVAVEAAEPAAPPEPEPDGAAAAGEDAGGDVPPAEGEEQPTS